MLFLGMGDNSDCSLVAEETQTQTQTLSLEIGSPSIVVLGDLQTSKKRRDEKGAALSRDMAVENKKRRCETDCELDEQSMLETPEKQVLPLAPLGEQTPLEEKTQTLLEEQLQPLALALEQSLEQSPPGEQALLEERELKQKEQLRTRVKDLEEWKADFIREKNFDNRVRMTTERNNRPQEEQDRGEETLCLGVETVEQKVPPPCPVVVEDSTHGVRIATLEKQMEEVVDNQLMDYEIQQNQKFAQTNKKHQRQKDQKEQSQLDQQEQEQEQKLTQESQTSQQEQEQKLTQESQTSQMNYVSQQISVDEAADAPAVLLKPVDALRLLVGEIIVIGDLLSDTRRRNPNQDDHFSRLKAILDQTRLIANTISSDEASQKQIEKVTAAQFTARRIKLDMKEQRISEMQRALADERQKFEDEKRIHDDNKILSAQPNIRREVAPSQFDFCPFDVPPILGEQALEEKAADRSACIESGSLTGNEAELIKELYRLLLVNARDSMCIRPDYPEAAAGKRGSQMTKHLRQLCTLAVKVNEQFNSIYQANRDRVLEFNDRMDKMSHECKEINVNAMCVRCHSTAAKSAKTTIAQCCNFVSAGENLTFDAMKKQATQLALAFRLTSQSHDVAFQSPFFALRQILRELVSVAHKSSPGLVCIPSVVDEDLQTQFMQEEKVSTQAATLQKVNTQTESSSSSSVAVAGQPPVLLPRRVFGVNVVLKIPATNFTPFVYLSEDIDATKVENVHSALAAVVPFQARDLLSDVFLSRLFCVASLVPDVCFLDKPNEQQQHVCSYRVLAFSQFELSCQLLARSAMVVQRDEVVANIFSDLFEHVQTNLRPFEGTIPLGMDNKHQLEQLNLLLQEEPYNEPALAMRCKLHEDKGARVADLKALLCLRPENAFARKQLEQEEEQGIPVGGQ